MRRPALAALLAALLALGLAPATATTGTEITNLPVVTSDNVEFLGTRPEATAAVSMAFSSDSPHAYVSTLQGIHVYDISDATAPSRVGYLPMVGYQNEAMALGERPETGEKFVTFASTLALVAPTTGDRDTSSRFFVVIDVSDPTDPHIVGRLQTQTRTHTVTCIDPECSYLVTDGRSQGQMSIVDMTDYRNPAMVDTYQSVVTLGHDADVDEEGILWFVGGEGSVALDMSDPTWPVELASTNADARNPGPWNKFIHHNSIRPNAGAFLSTEDPETGEVSSGDPSVFAGNVLLVTEEEVSQGACDDGSEGSFQTWYIPYLDAERYAEDNPFSERGGGTMTPLGRWNTELLDSGEPAEYGTRCSAHYFDFHQDGFIAQGWYGQGMRVLDVRDAAEPKQVGYWFAAASMVWGAYWVPAYDEDGRQTGERTDIVYSVDHVRGLDILRVELPETDPDDTEALRAPLHASWLAPRVADGFAPDPDFGWACPLPMGADALDSRL